MGEGVFALTAGIVFDQAPKVIKDAKVFVDNVFFNRP